MTNDTPDEIIIYTADDGSARVELALIGGDVLMTQSQMATLFGVTKQAISGHLLNIFKADELDEASVVKKFLSTAGDGKDYRVAHYNLDAIISVGYRVSSKRAVQFRKWATKVLVEFAVKGFVLDVERLKKPDGDAPDYFDELLEKIKEIRASEHRVWTHILGLTKLCTDHDDAGQKRFFETFQNTVHWAVVSMTAAETIHSRVDAEQPHCGVMHFKGDEPTVAEAQVGKNYYGEREIRELNSLTNRLLDYFKDQTERGKVVSLAAFEAKLQGSTNARS